MTSRTTTNTRRGLVGIAGAAAIGLALLQPSTGSADSHVNSGSLNGGTASPTPTPAPKLTTPDSEQCGQAQGACFFLRNSNSP